MISGEIIAAVCILLVACVLLGVSHRYEGFHSKIGVQCGVDMAPCANGTRCVNGYCESLDTPYLPPTSGLPVLPEGYSK
jgi:hypothetical protein